MRRIGFVLAVAVGILTSEAALLISSYYVPLVRYYLTSPWTRNAVDDPVLGFRMSPYYPGHDKRGYRNNQFPSTSAVLAIGDSLTYGFAAPPTGSWPYQLQLLSQKKVYNAGVGGYGPCEYEAVLDELLILQPNAVIIGFYMGNDLSDVYKSIYLDGRCAHLRITDETVLGEIENVNKKGTLPEMAMRYGMETDKARKNENVHFSARRWLAEHSSLYGLARSIQYAFANNSKIPLRDLDDSFEAAAKRPFRVAFNAVPEIRTVFRTPELDSLAVNVNDPRIHEGLRLTQSILLSINTKLKKRRVQLIVVLLHNKPYVYADILRKYWPTAPKELVDLTALEENATRLIIRFLDENSITYVRTLSALRHRLSQGEAAYPESDDHHPNSTGYLAIAESVLPFLGDTMRRQ